VGKCMLRATQSCFVMQLAKNSCKRRRVSQRKALDDTVNHDAHFLVGPQQVKMSGTRAQLASRSPYFQSMFFGSTKMQESQPNAVIKLEELDPEAFRNILQYCETESADLNEDNVIATLYAAKYLQLDILAEGCRTWLEEHLNEDTCLVIRQQAEQLNEPELMESAHAFILKHAGVVIQNNSFSELSKDYVKSLIARDDIYVQEVLYDCHIVL